MNAESNNNLLLLDDEVWKKWQLAAKQPIIKDETLINFINKECVSYATSQYALQIDQLILSLGEGLHWIEAMRLGYLCAENNLLEVGKETAYHAGLVYTMGMNIGKVDLIKACAALLYAHQLGHELAMSLLRHCCVYLTYYLGHILERKDLNPKRNHLMMIVMMISMS